MCSIGMFCSKDKLNIKIVDGWNCVEDDEKDDGNVVFRCAGCGRKVEAEAIKEIPRGFFIFLNS